MRCSVNWKNKLPIVKWLPLYSFSKLQCDFIAGITVGLMVIPQGLAYAVIAKLPPQYGLYSAFMGGFVYCLLGSSKDISLGPTAIMSLMVASYGDSQDPVSFALALSFFCGLIWLLMGLLSLGFIVRLIPLPVISGFISSAAIIIAVGQVKNILGLSNVPRDFFPELEKLVNLVGRTKVWDLVLGITCMLLLEFFRSFNRINWPESQPTLCQKISRKIIWLVAVGRNAIIVFSSALVAMAFHFQNSKPFSLTGKVKEGLPPFQIPKFHANVENTTISVTHMMSRVGVGFLVIPLIGFLEDVAIAQAFARRNKYNIDASQELIALGVANVLGSFISAYPITGSFSRTTVNAISGVATPFGGVFTGCVVLLALSVLTPFFQYIPKASLSAIIIMSVLRMVDVKIVKTIWRTNRVDLLPFFVTFFVCFYELDIGIACGVAVALMIVLYRHFVPRVEIETRHVCFVRFNGGLTYMGIEYFISKVRKAVFLSKVKPAVVVIDCAAMPESDFTVTQGFAEVVQDCEARDIKVRLINVQESIKQMFVQGGLPLKLFRKDLNEELTGLLRQDNNSTTMADNQVGII